MSLSLIALKILAPAVAKRLLDAIDIDSNLANKVLEKAIDVAADGIAEGDDRQAFEQKIQQISGQLETQMLPLFEQEARNLATSCT